MHKNLKNFFLVSWPFFGLFIAAFFVWNFFAPHFSGNQIGESNVSSIREYVPEYNVFSAQDDLRPVRMEELPLVEKIDVSGILETKNGRRIEVATSEELSAALQSADDDDVIALGKGEFAINLRIEKDILLLGQGSETVLVAKDQGEPVLKIVSCSADLENFEIKDSAIGIEASETKLKIRNVALENIGISSCYAKLSKVDVSGVNIRESFSAFKFVDSEGVIFSSIAENNTKSGIHLINSRFSVKGNKIVGNGSYGIYADANSEVVVEGNFIEKNKGFNVRIESKKAIYR